MLNLARKRRNGEFDQGLAEYFTNASYLQAALWV